MLDGVGGDAYMSYTSATLQIHRTKNLFSWNDFVKIVTQDVLDYGEKNWNSFKIT